MRLRRALLLLCLSSSFAHAGAFIFADEANPDLVTHPNGYTGTGGPRVQTVCLRTATLPAGVTATQVENTVLKAVETWNAQRVTTANLGIGAANDIPNGKVDFESALLHEFGHCLGLEHPNHASESGLDDPQANGTKSTDGANNVFNQGAGVDGLHGSADDARGDDGNLYWYRNGSNDPLAFPAIIDETTFRRPLTALPAGHAFARNGDRDVLSALGVAHTESVMQQGQFSDEAQRRLTGEEMSTIRLGAAGLDSEQGTSDDYTVSLDYIGRTQNCNITVEFDSAAGFAGCSVGGQSINATHVRITSAALEFATNVSWFFSQAPNTTTTITADSPDPTKPGATYSVSVAVAVNTSSPTGPATGTVEISDDLGSTCTATLGAGSGSCNLTGTSNGTRTLTATYLGFRGFDASTSAPVTHTIATSSATLTLSETPTTTVVGQTYTVNASVSGSVGTPTGSVAIDDGHGASCNITLSNGNGSCTLASASSGSLTLTGDYSGDATYSSDTDTEPHSVNDAATTTSIVLHTPATTVVGQPYVVNVTVAVDAPGAGTPSGTVAVNDGNGQSCNATLTAGAGSCTLTSVTVGSLTLSASYPGNADFDPSSDTASHTVNKANTTLSIVADAPDASSPGQNVFVGFALSAAAPGAGTPTGTVVVTASGGSETCTATLPQTNCTLALNQVGARVLTASYSGDARFNASSDTETHTVNNATSITAIAADLPDASRVGEPVTVDVSVTPQAPALGVPSGSVTVTASGGSESCTVTLPATNCAITLTATGSRTLTASYSGDASFKPSSDTEPHQVLAADTLTTISNVQPQPSTIGQSYAVTVTVAASPPGAGAPSGLITVTDSLGGICGGSLIAGSMSCAINPTVAGVRTLTANYAGNANFAASSTTAPHTVRAATQLAFVSILPKPTAIGENATVTIAITTEPNLPAPSGTIAISSDREPITCQIALPQTTCTLSPTVVAIHRVHASYPGDANYAPAQVDTNHRVVAAGTIFIDGFED